MFELADLRKTRVWQEAHEEGRALEKKDIVRKLLANGMSVKEVAQNLEISVAQVKRLSKDEPD